MRLRFGISRQNFIDLPRTSVGWQPNEGQYYEAVAAAGFEAVQGGTGKCCREHGLTLLGVGVVRDVAEACAFAQHWSDEGAELATCIAGTGLESDEETDALIEAIQQCAQRSRLPVFIETHRASITQDIWRTNRMLERNPALSLNLDFSHWYTGLELQALESSAVENAMEAIVAHTKFLHGRIGDRCCMQVPLDGNEDALLTPFLNIWQRVLAHHESARLPADFWFVTELLGPTFQYARLVNGKEEGDRWRDACLLREHLALLKRCVE